MFRYFKSKCQRVLGVDIGTTAVKIMELSNHHNKFSIESYGCEYFSPSPMESDAEALVSSIKKLLSAINSSAQWAAIAVPDAVVVSKTIQCVDSLNEQEVEELIILKADDYLTYPSDKMYFDFVLQETKEAGMMEVLLFASKAEPIKSRIELLKRAGLEVKLVGIESHVIADVDQLLNNQIHINNLTNLEPLFLLAFGLAMKLGQCRWK